MVLEHLERVFEADNLHAHAEKVQGRIRDWPSYEDIHGRTFLDTSKRGDEAMSTQELLPFLEGGAQRPCEGQSFDEVIRGHAISSTHVHETEKRATPFDFLSRHEYEHVYWGFAEEQSKQFQIPRSANVKEGLFAAKTHEEVLDFLSHHNLQVHADDYLSYIKWREVDLEEDESPGIILQSLQSWAWFIYDYARPKGLAYSKLKADFDGCVRLTWKLSDKVLHIDSDSEYWGNGYGIAVLKFYPSSLNYFSMMSGPFASERRRLTLEGYLSYERTCQIIDMYAVRFLNEEG